MAELDRLDEGWWKYALEFARRGLWPMNTVETHGPHEQPADRIWGEAFCRYYDGHGYFDVIFEGPHNCKHFSDIHGLRMQAKDDPEMRFPILQAKESNRAVKKWIAYARKQTKA